MMASMELHIDTKSCLISKQFNTLQIFDTYHPLIILFTENKIEWKNMIINLPRIGHFLTIAFEFYQSMMCWIQMFPCFSTFSDITHCGTFEFLSFNAFIMSYYHWYKIIFSWILNLFKIFDILWIQSSSCTQKIKISVPNGPPMWSKMENFLSITEIFHNLTKNVLLWYCLTDVPFSIQWNGEYKCLQDFEYPLLSLHFNDFNWFDPLNRTSIPR